MYKVTDQVQNPSLPEFYDLRQEFGGCFTPVVNQGSCGSCWSFSVANTISDAYAIANAKANSTGSCPKYVNMSEEDLIWCSGATDGNGGGKCDGGSISVALNYVAASGISTEKCNPYGHGDGADSFGYGGCPTTCKGSGDINNRVTPVGFTANCTDTDNGAKDGYGDGCDAYNKNTSWCGNYNTDTFKSDEMCCGCKGASVENVTTTATIQSYLKEYGPMAVGMPVYEQMYGIGSAVYKPIADQKYSGGHAIECLGWGHDDNGEGFWIMKNSWGCNWGDAGYFKQSWAFNSESYFFGLKINGSSSFTNDVPLTEEPECKVPEDSNNSDHCAQYSEFDTCKLCNSGYELTSEQTCVLKDEEIDEEEQDPEDDNETPSEDIFWQECKNAAGQMGYICPADTFHACLTLHDGDEVDCSTFIDMVAQAHFPTNCSLCPPALIDFCATQNNDKCMECIPGYSPNATQDVCLADACTAAMESTASGDCVVPVMNCTPGSSVKLANGDVICDSCMPGFEMNKPWDCMALPDPENCAEVEMTNPERTCKVCNEGYYAGPLGKCHPDEEEGDGECKDSDNGAVDPFGDDCNAYTAHPSWCGGMWDDDDFKSDEMCCVCKSSKNKSSKWNKTKQLAKSLIRQRLNKSTRKSQRNKNASKRLSSKKSRVNRKKLSKK